jgi:hypothetical protein
MKKKISRREFLKYSGLTGAAAVSGPLLVGLNRGPHGKAWAAKPSIPSQVWLQHGELQHNKAP